MNKIKKCWCGGKAMLPAFSEVGDKPYCRESKFHDPTATGHKERIRKLYIAGPMTGFPDCNYPAFHAAAEHLDALGYDVANPAEISAGVQAHYVDYLREDLRALLDCDGVALLPGWEFSTGARNEVNVAGLLKMPVRPLSDWEASS